MLECVWVCFRLVCSLLFSHVFACRVAIVGFSAHPCDLLCCRFSVLFSAIFFLLLSCSHVTASCSFVLVACYIASLMKVLE